LLGVLYPLLFSVNEFVYFTCMILLISEIFQNPIHPYLNVLVNGMIQL